MDQDFISVAELEGVVATKHQRGISPQFERQLTEGTWVRSCSASSTTTP